ncbi:uncharacterized protein AB675_8174 [Cyphellophora attinorum]|uniref:Uncharacterized protein n=1 Tax=Cyphellophora attinorum TaxID=1664694 RepID=A0A0N1NZC0_9EURO|nr:uncharacterized protein AB675_8174 [Phialophora attinorum]KPI41325.1 hypothetical protein AB675_8174 [Phialophora attinorum]
MFFVSVLLSFGLDYYSLRDDMCKVNLAAVVLLLGVVSAGQPTAPDPYEAPLRDLTFGQLNFLHTTDTHGWHAGHLLEKSYSADWGDYVDFADRLRERLEDDAKDLLLIDTGDRIEGNGLYDASSPRGKYTFDIFKEQQIDLICSGNHELYKASSALDEHHITVPDFNDAYLASNLDILDPETGAFVPLAAKWKKFATKKQGIRVMSFGFIYDFTRNSNNTRVQPVEDTLRETWFQDAIRDEEVDLFIVIGHAAVRSDEFSAIYKEIRSARWDTPIQFFGGHFHIRDYKKFDAAAYGLASGRFMETIGFQSINGLSTNDFERQRTPTFSRRYIDNNLYSFYHHSGHNASTFHSKKGRHVSKLIQKSRSALDLDHVYGCATDDLWMSRSPYPSNSSIFSWLEEQVLPVIANETSRSHKARFVLLNTGAIRFDIFKGPFTRDSTFIVSPFTSSLRVLPDVPYGKAKQLIKILNSAGQIFSQVTDKKLDLRDLAPASQHTVDSTSDSTRASQIVQSNEVQRVLIGHADTSALTSSVTLQPGYTTSDDAGKDGDDTIHSTIDFYRVPNVIQSFVNSTSNPLSDEDTVDVVFNEFIQPYLLLALRFVGQIYEDGDTKTYLKGTSFTKLLSEWIVDNWGKNC